MIELHSWIIIAWTAGTALMAFGSAWGAVRVTQKSVENTLKELKKTLKEQQKNVDNLRTRVLQDEKDYTTRTDCHDVRGECREQQAKDNSSICAKIEEIKSSLKNKVDKELFEERMANMIRTLDRIDQRVEKIAKSNGFE